MQKVVMSTNFGITVPNDVKRRVEASLGYGDSRSGRIVELVRIGLEAEETMNDTGTYNPDMERRLEFVREAIESHAADIDE